MESAIRLEGINGVTQIKIMQPRFYQVDTITGIQKKFREGVRYLLLVLYMGLGKTVCASMIVQKSVQNGKRVLFIAHRTFLIKQARDKFLKFGIQCGIIKAGFKEDRTQKVQIASIQTLMNRKLPLADIVIIDEAHRSCAKEYVKIIEEYKKANAFIIGMTATPFLTERRKGLDLVYQDYVNTITVKEGIEKGFIVESKVFLSKKFVDTSNIKKKSKGDFEEKELFKAFDFPECYENFINAYHIHIGNKKTIVFCVNKEHCRKTCESLITAGYRGNYIVAETSEEDRDLYMSRLLSGEYHFICNVSIFCEGFDMPELESIALNFDTESKSKYHQCAGRGGRILPEDEGVPFEKRKKKFFTILDVAGNTARHGWIEQEYQISLGPQITKEKSGIAPIRACPSCGFMFAVQLKKCPECGCEVEVKKTKKEIEQEEFVELDKKRMEAQKYLDYGKDKWHLIPSDMLVEYAKAKGYKSPRGWANYLLLERGEGIKKVVIRNYTEPDYFKQCAILRKGYFQKTYPIDAEVWQFIEETNKEVIFEYKLAEKETIL